MVVAARKVLLIWPRYRLFLTCRPMLRHAQQDWRPGVFTDLRHALAVDRNATEGLVT